MRPAHLGVKVSSGVKPASMCLPALGVPGHRSILVRILHVLKLGGMRHVFSLEDLFNYYYIRDIHDTIYVSSVFIPAKQSSRSFSQPCSRSSARQSPRSCLQSCSRSSARQSCRVLRRTNFRPTRPPTVPQTWRWKQMEP